MTADLVTTEQPVTALSEQMDYARAVASANMLPQAYRGKPADIMLAVGLGGSMGLSPAESLYRINVIQGTPTASAELIASNVRKAGHVLRLRVDEQAVSATCTIIRADDRDYEHTVTRDKAWAQKMGLAGKDNYTKQPATMLGWRAVSACARMACPEALYGVAYSADEITDSGPRPVPQVADTSTSSRMAAMLTDEPGPPVQNANESADVMLNPQSALGRKMFATLGDIGVTDKADRLAFVTEYVGRPIESSTELTEDEARTVVAAAESIAAPEQDGAES